MKGLVFGIQHFSIHDGNGIRTNIFMMGCPLHCIWCHNPEGMSYRPLLSYSSNKCGGCGACFLLCPETHCMDNGVHRINREICKRCFRCADNCPCQALEQVGKQMTAGEIMEAIIRDKRYYSTSGGGATISGGEPMSQFDFTLAILESCRGEGINTALETCGFARTEQFERILPYVDTFLYDIKESDAALHKAHTGADNKQIMFNLEFLSTKGAAIILRCPIIPGLNDRKDHFEFIARLTNDMPGIKGAEIMPYHKLGASKAARMGIEEQCVYEQPSDETVMGWNRAIAGAGGKIVKY